MVYLIQDVVAASEIIPELSCPHCQASGKIEISITRTNLSVGIIPMLAWRKRGEFVCHNCGLPVRLEEGGEPFKRAYLTLKTQARTPIYLWSGMIISCIVLFGGLAYMLYEEHNNPWTQKIEPAMLTAPKVGDLYEVSVERTTDLIAGTTGYTLARVEKIEGDLVTLRYRKNAIQRRSPPLLKELINTPGVFDDKDITVEKNKLRNRDLFPPKSDCIGMIYAVKRP
jgi:hypothetical protein